MDVLIVGEDEVTKAIIRRILLDYRKDIVIENELPARGGQIKQFAPKYNKIDSPIILLTDLDLYNCAPTLIKDWFKDEPLTQQFCFRVACDEAEGWLMSDRQGFAKWIGVDIDLIPEPILIDRKKNLEMRFKMKPSLFLMKKLAENSRIEKLKRDLVPVNGASKGR